MPVEVVAQVEQMARLKISDIRTNPEALRGVNKTEADYQEFAANIAARGVITPIRVRQCVDTDTNENFFLLIDGLQRYTAAMDAGFEDIKAVICSSTDDEVLEEQMILNLFRIETKPVEYTQQLRRILRNDPSMTMAKLAGKLKKSESWLKNRLQLTKLTPEVAELVDGGQINLNNAYALSALPAENQPELIDAAMNKTYQEFAAIADNRRKELNKARKAGESDQPVVFEPKQSQRKAGDVAEEIGSGKVASIILDGVTDVADAFRLALEWSLSLDKFSVEEQERKFNEDQAAKAAKREAAKKDREARNEKAGAIKAARMQLQFELQDLDIPNAEKISRLAQFDIENNIAPPKVSVKKPKAEGTDAPATDAPVAE